MIVCIYPTTCHGQDVIESQYLELNTDAACCFEQMLEAVPYKTVVA